MDTKTDTVGFRLYSKLYASLNDGKVPNPNQRFWCPYCHKPDSTKNKRVCDSCRAGGR